MAVSFVRYLLLLFCLGGTSVMDVYGNDEAYNLHLRTADLWLPWQPIAPHSSHHPTGKPYICPLRDFTPYKTGKALDLIKLARIGVLAIGRAFQADVRIARVGFY